jgi:uncharacterized protein YrzB (UPF0473 family)
MEEELINVVKLVDEDGNEVEFDHLMTFEHEGKHYVALMPMDEVEGVGDDEVLILRINENGEEDTYEAIENEVLLDELFNAFMELWEEQDEDEDED